MERNILIPIISFNLWNKQEITNFISRYLSRLSKQWPSSEPDQPSVQSDDIEDIAALNIKAEWIRRLQEILEQLEDMTLQTRAMAESAEMKATDEERIRVGQYIVNRILEYEALPTEAERTAAEKMVREITPYRGFYRKPVGQRSSLINGLLRDAKKSTRSASRRFTWRSPSPSCNASTRSTSRSRSSVRQRKKLRKNRLRRATWRTRRSSSSTI